MATTIEWLDDPAAQIRLIDQTMLPRQEVYRHISTVDDLVMAIEQLAVRGAPALGAAGGLGVLLAMAQSERENWSRERLDREVARLRAARPTAVNLAWGVDRVSAAADQGYGPARREALAILQEDDVNNRSLSRLGADWILDRVDRRKIRVITHCNTGALAATAWGTAYGIIHELHHRQQVEIVYVDETRPLLQGSRLTSWELTQDGIEHVIQVDGAASSTILRGLVDVAIIGADRIAANGDTANKIGSVALALACARASIPFVVAAPFSTVDLSMETGAGIVIEERDAAEVASFGGLDVAVPDVKVFNPAFDVTPHDLISAVVTERGVFEPSEGSTLHEIGRGRVDSGG
jgi:methylthioribose-1-phosphate isomerase